ncbi:MAG: hypothetical protein K6G15_05375 [Desulfovibrio sp.]|nr:hypothetical protein [Desulfovibrio sp.]
MDETDSKGEAENGTVYPPFLLASFLAQAFLADLPSPCFAKRFLQHA